MKELTFHRLLVQTADQHSDSIGYVEDGIQETVGVHVDRTLRIIEVLRGLGLAAGDRVAVVADGGRHVINVLHAAALGGFIAVPLNVRAAVPELADLIDHAGPRVVITDRKHLDVTERAISVARSAPRVLPFEADSGDSLLGLAAAADPVVPAEPDEDTPLLILHTGGTTGRARGSVWDNRQLVLSLQRMHRQMDVLRPGMSILSANPLFHIGAINSAYAFPAAGNTVVLRTMFVPAEVIHDVPAHGVTHLPLVTPILQRLMDDPAFEAEAFRSIQFISYGGAAITPALLGRVLTAFPGAELQNCYGMTEAGVVTVLTGADHRRGGRFLASVGRALPGVVVSIRLADGTELARGEVGEICIGSGSVAQREWGSDVPQIEPWLRTGDLARQDDEGYIYLVDRAKDMIISGGENVYSAEVESVLLRHEAVAQVAVIGLADEQWGERVHAVVIPEPGSTPTEAELIAFVRVRLAGYKTPKSIDVRGEPFPVSAVGKVLKRELRAQYAHG